MSWNNIFKEGLKRERSILAHYTACLVQNWRFVYKIRQYLPKDKISRIMEPGAGTGYLAIYLSSLGHKVSAIDIDTGFIEEVNSALQSGLHILKQDIRESLGNESCHFDLIYNIGVMEHFSDEDIIKICKNFKVYSDIFIFAVPNFKIPYSYGNERYLSKRRWRKLLRSAG